MTTILTVQIPPRLPLVDHTDQFHQTQSTPFYRGLCGTHRFTTVTINSYTYRSHQPNDFHADSQSANLLHPTGSRHLDCLENTFSVISCTRPRVFIPITTKLGQHDLTTLRMLNCKGIFDISNGFGRNEVTNVWQEGKQEVCYSVFRMRC